jgi:hypothetical protein
LFFLVLRFPEKILKILCRLSPVPASAKRAYAEVKYLVPGRQ